MKTGGIYLWLQILTNQAFGTWRFIKMSFLLSIQHSNVWNSRSDLMMNNVSITFLIDIKKVFFWTSEARPCSAWIWKEYQILTVQLEILLCYSWLYLPFLVVLVSLPFMPCHHAINVDRTNNKKLQAGWMVTHPSLKVPNETNKQTNKQANKQTT